MMRRGGAGLPQALVLGVVLVSACSSHPAFSGATEPAPTPVSSVTVTTGSTPLTPNEAIVRALGTSGADRVGWLRAPAQRILVTYFAPGQRYLGGQLVAPTDEILVIKMHGSFEHSAPQGGNSRASLALAFYNLTTGKSIPFSQMWDDGAPDLGVGPTLAQPTVTSP